MPRANPEAITKPASARSRASIVANFRAPRNPAIVMTGLVPAIPLLLGVKQKRRAVRYDADMTKEKADDLARRPVAPHRTGRAHARGRLGGVARRDRRA